MPTDISKSIPLVNLVPFSYFALFADFVHFSSFILLSTFRSLCQNCFRLLPLKSPLCNFSCTCPQYYQPQGIFPYLSLPSPHPCLMRAPMMYPSLLSDDEIHPPLSEGSSGEVVASLKHCANHPRCNLTRPWGMIAEGPSTSGIVTQSLIFQHEGDR